MADRAVLDGGGSLAALARFGLTGESERLVQALIGHTPVGVFVTNTEGECVYANARLCELTGLPFEQLLGFGWRTALHPDDAERVAGAWEAATRDGTRFEEDQRFVRPDGSVCQVETSAEAVRDQDGLLIGWAGVCVDVSRYRALIDNARTAIFTADPAGAFISVNPAAEAMSGYSREELLAMNFFDLIAPEDSEHARAALARAFAGRADTSVELQLTTKDGRRVVVETWGRLVLEDGVPVRFEGIAAETTERHLLQDQLTHQAFHDPLTGLPNRALLLDRISQAMTRAERPGAQVAVILLDLDDFKLVNDSLGHYAGDTLLAEVASRLQQEVRASDTVARLGGDEFALLIESCTDDCDLLALAERLLASFDAPFTLADGTQRITATLGMALAHPGEAPEAALRNADTAMYAAKTAQKGSYELFDDAMRARAVRKREIRNALVDTLEAGELGVHYQPIVSLSTGEILALEALVRWLHPQWGWVQPSEFIPIAEGDSLIVRLGRHVLSAVAGQTALWDMHYPAALPMGVFVNASPREIAQPDYLDAYQATLREQGLAAARIGIEVTEQSFIDERDQTVATNLDELARLGVHLSLDDFGTGYSSLAALKRFPFTAVKIDRYFTRTIHHPDDPAPITEAIVGLGQTLGLTVIAEGVETAAQADHLHQIGCHAAQGYHYARPQPADTITSYLAAHLHNTQTPLLQAIS